MQKLQFNGIDSLGRYADASARETGQSFIDLARTLDRRSMSQCVYAVARSAARMLQRGGYGSKALLEEFDVFRESFYTTDPRSHLLASLVSSKKDGHGNDMFLVIFNREERAQHIADSRAAMMARRIALAVAEPAPDPRRRSIGV